MGDVHVKQLTVSSVDYVEHELIRQVCYVDAEQATTHVDNALLLLMLLFIMLELEFYWRESYDIPFFFFISFFLSTQWVHL